MSDTAQSTLRLPNLPGIEAGWEIITVDTDRKSGRFTAEQLAKNEEKRQAVLAALAEGLGVRAVARAFGISVNTVTAAEERWGQEIETLKQSMGRQALKVARLAMERIGDEIDLMPRASLPIIAGVMVDKAQLLTGAPTARVQHDHTLSPASVADYIASLPSAQPVASGEGAGQKAIAGEVGQVIDLAPAGAVDLVGGSSERSASADSKSVVSAQLPEQDGRSGSDVGQIEHQKGGRS